MNRFAGTISVFAVVFIAAGLAVSSGLIDHYIVDWSATVFGTFIAFIGGLFIGGVTDQERSKLRRRTSVIWGGAASRHLCSRFLSPGL